MSAELLRVDPERIDREAIARAGETIRHGGLVAFPTETVYGLGANALDERAVRRIFEAKGRPFNDPLIVHLVREWPLANVVAERAAPAVERLAEAFWPGPLTVVAPRGPGVAAAVSAGLATVGVRCPAHPVAIALLQAAGVPIAAPSANRFGHVSPTSAQHVIDDLADACDMIIDGGRTEYGIESTVVALEASELVILRHGAITLEQLQGAVGPGVQVREAGTREHHARSPGRQRRHYSPRSPTLAVQPSVFRAPLPEGLARVTKVTYLGYEDRAPELPAGWSFQSLGRLDDLRGVAFDLYDNLRRQDAAAAGRTIVAELTQATGLGRAIDDRLVRAAGGRVVSSAAELEEALTAS